MSEEEDQVGGGTYVVDEVNGEDIVAEAEGEDQEREEDPLLDDEEEKKRKKRKKRKKSIVRNLLYACLALVILIIVTAITTVLIILYGRETKEKPLFGFDDMFDSQYQPSSIDVQWSLHDENDPTLTYWDTDGNIITYTPGVSDRETLLSSSVVSTIGGENGDPYTVTTDERFVLIKTNTEKIWRHSSWGQYVAYDVVNKVKVQNFPQGVKQRNLVTCHSNSSLVAYVDDDNDIIIRDLTSTVAGTKITNDGEVTTMFNGAADWVYEEDVLGEYNTMKFSPDCKSLAYISLDDTDLDIFYDPYYDVSSAFPTYSQIRYPIVGQSIPKATMSVYEIGSGDHKVTLGTSDDPGTYWIYDFKWTVGSNLVVTVFPRDQRIKNVTLAKQNVGTGTYEGTVVKTMTTDTWFPSRREVCFTDETTYLDVFLIGDRYGIKSVDTNTGVETVIVSDEYDVEEIFCEGMGRQPTDGYVYYRAINAIYSQIFRVSIDTKTVTSYSNGDSFCTAKMDPLGQYYVYNYQGPSYPSQELRKLSDNSVVWKMNNNDDLKDKLDKFELPDVDVSQTLSVSGVSKDMDMMLMRPPYFSDTDVYPALIHVYNGPSSKTVTGRYSSLYDPFNMYMASQGFIVATVDGRGTRGKGHNFMTSVYKQLGKYETDDQVSLRTYLGDESFVDKEKISIWGWSYGGFMTLYGTTQDTNYVSAVAVAPDCSHRGYDAAYSERYMGSGSNTGYNTSNVLERVDKDSFKDTKLLMVHGMSDDNVHPFNTYNMMTLLQDYEIQFDVMIFPNKAHSLQGTATRKFLYQKISDFLVDNGN